MDFQKEGPQVPSKYQMKVSQQSVNQDSKKTVIIGASNNPNRYAHIAAERLSRHEHPIIPVGIKKGNVLGIDILDISQKPVIDDVDTVTMYINPQHQIEWEDYILSLKPRRIIFNPGTENPSLAQRAQAQGIETENACTLVMLSVGNY